MTAKAKKLALVLFQTYEDKSVLLKVDFKDEEDLMLERLERDIDRRECDEDEVTHSSRPDSINVSP